MEQILERDSCAHYLSGRFHAVPGSCGRIAVCLLCSCRQLCTLPEARHIHSDTNKSVQPFNAFLSGFSAAVGQFVLTASLRMQTTERPPTAVAALPRKPTTKTVDGITGEVIEDGTSKISSERAFADFVFGSLILHAFCINFIN